MDARDDQFWAWALARYERAPLQALLLQAQDDYGLVVLEVLLAAWLAEMGVTYDVTLRASVLSRAVTWEEDVIRPLRSRRRVWRDKLALQDMRARLQSLELQAERELAAIMIAALPDITEGGPPHDVMDNLKQAAAQTPAATPLLERIASCLQRA